MGKIWKAGASLVVLLIVGTAIATVGVRAQTGPGSGTPKSSYLPVTEEDFRTVFARMSGAKASTMKRQMDLLSQRYDPGNRPAPGVTMSRGKPVQEGVRVRLPGGVASWEVLAQMSPDDIRAKGLYPPGFMPLPHENHPESGMVFPQFLINELKRQTSRDLTRFDLDFDLPTTFSRSFPLPCISPRVPISATSRGGSWSRRTISTSSSTGS